MSAKRFTEEQESDIVRRYLAGESSNDIAAALGCPGKTVVGVVRRAGVELRTRNPVVTDEQRNLAIRLCTEEGLVLEDAAEKAGISKRHLSKVLAERGISLTMGRPRTKTVNHAAFDTLTPDGAYWAGFLFADGCVHWNDQGQAVIATGLQISDLAHVEKLRAFLGSDHTIGVTPEGKVTTFGGGQQTTFRVRSNRLASALEHWGLVDVKAERVPRNGMEDSRDFWRGMVDGDGSVSKPESECYIYLCGQLSIVQAYCDFLRRNSIKPGTVLPTNSGIFYSQVTHRQAIKTMRLLYNNCSTALDRKNISATYWIQNAPSATGRWPAED